MNRSSEVMRGGIPRLYLVVAALALGSASVQGLCERGRTWWHRQLGTCLPCTSCDPRHLAVQYPCEVHRDTVCQSLYEIRIWPFHRPARNYNATNDSEPSDDEYEEYTDYDKVTESVGDVSGWDIQTSTLTVAASGCVVFFIVVVSLSVYHARQWKVLKLALKSDFHDLSAKLKLMEAGGEPPAEPVVPTDHHVYSNIHIGKDALLGPGAAKKGLGNVYTQEKHSS
ncbi:tumor necrosis factor receptor superfamily member wengen [Epargyreus clarus]|uniref:tumor necrosis factor receptor superfamily member wengen n=1 Tax=Epargyreus clarus TaxID=520877 RepID=UPI003C2CBE72